MDNKKLRKKISKTIENQLDLNDELLDQILDLTDKVERANYDRDFVSTLLGLAINYIAAAGDIDATAREAHVDAANAFSDLIAEQGALYTPEAGTEPDYDDVVGNSDEDYDEDCNCTYCQECRYEVENHVAKYNHRPALVKA